MKSSKIVFIIVAVLLVSLIIFSSCGNNAVLSTITVYPINPTIAQGSTLQFTATGTYSDDSVSDLSTSVTWSSSNTLVSTISNTEGSQGLATAVATGTTNMADSCQGENSFPCPFV